jgi:hypothetical protein
MSERTSKVIRHKAEQYRNRIIRAHIDQVKGLPFKARFKVACSIVMGKGKARA